VRVLVVDDEPVARRRLIRMIDRIDGVELAGEACDGHDARDKIAELAPDVVLLDIHMPGLDGLTLAITTPNLPPVIFTTAYDQHAVDAFEVSAVDYLMKPIKQARLVKALAKVRQGGADPASIMTMLERLVDSDRKAAHRIVAREGDALRMFDARDIARFHAADKYAVFVSEGREVLLEESLHALEERLAPFDFIRVHRAELINLNHVVALRADGGGGLVELRDGQLARVSRRHLPALRRALRLE
jgi:DNA-binding LytR/AlgR family response regulator